MFNLESMSRNSFLFFVSILFFVSVSQAAPAPVKHFSGVLLSNVSMTLYGFLSFDGRPAPEGVEIAVYDRDGVLCGASGVDTKNGGAFLIQIYGDDPTTVEIDEGAGKGEPLTLKIFAGKKYGEFTQDLLYLSSAGYVDPPNFPPSFEDKASYGMKVDVAVALP